MASNISFVLCDKREVLFGKTSGESLLHLSIAYFTSYAFAASKDTFWLQMLEPK